MYELRTALDKSQTRTLALLARSPNGCPESLLVHGHKVPLEILVGLIHAGLASVRIERLARPAIEVTHVESRAQARRPDSR